MMDFLEKYEFITSWILLLIEIVFLCLMLWEFKYIRKEQKDRREGKTGSELCYFALSVVSEYVTRFNELIGIEKQNEEGIKKMLSGEYVDNYCKEVSDNCFLPLSFCKEIMNSALSNALRYSRMKDEDELNTVNFYNSLARTNNEYSGGHVTPRFINKCKKHFKSDDEIDAIYEKLTNIKL